MVGTSIRTTDCQNTTGNLRNNYFSFAVCLVCSDLLQFNFVLVQWLLPNPLLPAESLQRKQYRLGDAASDFVSLKRNKIPRF